MLGTDEYVDTAIDFHSLSYNTGTVSDKEKEQFPDKYTVYSYRRSGLSMIENSFVIGLIATAIAYALGLPLGMLMARRKDKLADKLGNAYIIFIMAVPSLAYIFMFAAIGTRCSACHTNSPTPRSRSWPTSCPPSPWPCPRSAA